MLKIFAVRKDRVAIQPVICSVLFCNSDLHLSVDSYRGSEILPQGSATALNKDHMSCDQDLWHNPNQSLSLKP